VAPAAVLGALELGVDEAIDGLATDDRVAVLERQAAADFGGRPAFGQMVEHAGAQHRVALQA